MTAFTKTTTRPVFADVAIADTGALTWCAKKNDRYLVTGTTTDGKRFRMVHTNPHHALGINLYRGKVWLVREHEGRTCRKLLKDVFN